MKKLIFIIAFGIILVLPNIIFIVFRDNFSTENYEKREMAQFPKIGERALDEFPGQIEEYINDHAAFKNEVVFLDNLINMKLFKISSHESVIVGEDNWLFFSANTINNYKGIGFLEEDQIELLVRNAERLDAYYRENGKQFVLLIAPNKEQIYSEKMPQGIKVFTDKSQADFVVEELTNKTDVTVLYPKKELIEEHWDLQLYHKYDTHWNIVGANIATKELVKSLDINPIDLVGEIDEENYQGDLVNYLSMNSILNDDYTYRFLQTDTDIKTEKGSIKKIRNGESYYLEEYKSNSGNYNKLLVVGDSFRYGMLPSLTYYFDEVIGIDKELYSLDILDEIEADIVVHILLERNIESTLIHEFGSEQFWGTEY